MGILSKHLGLYTDFYELIMAQGYYLSGKENKTACFEYFFRENPFSGGYVIFAGLSDVLEVLKDLRFDIEDISFLKTKGFDKNFLEYLKTFRFRASVYSAREGEVVFPAEVVLRVEGGVLEAQIVETMILNFLNYSSLVATKAARMCLAAKGTSVVDFGLRRAPALGGVYASKAAVIGGVDATSNVYASCLYDIEATGTQAHSWVQSFETEIEAFQKFAEIFPDRCILVVDTYDTLKSGIPNAIKAAKELEAKGHKMVGIRIDSGDLEYYAKRSRSMLDKANLSYVKIFASNKIDEFVIRSLKEQGAPIDGFGVGTKLVTGDGSGALDGVYKMCAFDNKPKLKISENRSKMTLPGKKKTVRYTDRSGMFYADGILLDDEAGVDKIFHPHFSEKYSSLSGLKEEPLIQKVMDNGNHVKMSSVNESAAYAKKRLDKLPKEHRRLENPHIYKVGISRSLMDLKDKMVEQGGSRSKTEN